MSFGRNFSAKQVCGLGRGRRIFQIFTHISNVCRVSGGTTVFKKNRVKTYWTLKGASWYLPGFVHKTERNFGFRNAPPARSTQPPRNSTYCVVQYSEFLGGCVLLAEGAFLKSKFRSVLSTS